MEDSQLLKALTDDTRLKIVTLLLRQNLCVRALARQLDISEPAVSQHLGVLKRVGLLRGEKHGHFMHYEVNRDRLRCLAQEIEALAAIQREDAHAHGHCSHHGPHAHCDEKARAICHGEAFPFAPQEER